MAGSLLVVAQFALIALLVWPWTAARVRAPGRAGRYRRTRSWAALSLPCADGGSGAEGSEKNPANWH